MWYEALFLWFDRNSRRFPWREVGDWYRVLIAEYMLIRTRAEVVLKHYQRFLELYPTPRDLCNASDKDLREFFKTLGLLYRGPRLRESVCTIIERYGGEPPCRGDMLRELPGVGRYLANILLTRVCKDPHPFVDTNVLRFLRRFLGVDDLDIDGAEAWLRDNVPREHLENVNTAILDLAALLCRSRAPRCLQCPLRNMCRYVMKAVNTDK